MVGSRQMKRMAASWLTVSVVALGGLTGCKKPPQDAIDGAERALLDAEARKDCSQDKYAAAQKLLDEAKKLVEEKKYKEAERKAQAAQKMAEDAKKTADNNWEDCNRRKEAVAEAKKPVKTDDGPKTDAPAELRTVFFAYDSAELTPAQRQQLEQNARWIRQNKPGSMILEGHTDERGSDEYNIALGERRAMAARQYLIQLGIDEGELRILSYGEEKPASYGASESDYRQNRRVEFKPK